MFLWAFLDFNLNMGWLAFLGAIIGAIIGLTVGWLLGGVPGLSSDTKDKTSYDIRVMSMALFFNLVPYTLQYINNAPGAATNACDGHVIREKHKVGYRNRGRYVDIEYQGRSEKLQIPRGLYDASSEGDKLQVCVSSGTLGFDHITGIDKIVN